MHVPSVKLIDFIDIPAKARYYELNSTQPARRQPAVMPFVGEANPNPLRQRGTVLRIIRELFAYLQAIQQQRLYR